MSTTMTSPTGPSPVSYAPAPRPLSQRINWRIVGFLAAVSAPFLYFFYVLVSQAVTGGVIRHGDYAEVDLKALGNFPFDAKDGTINDVPPRFRELDGMKVQLEGFMYSPQNAGTKGTEFQFVYNVSKCCFNGPPQVQERVFAYAKQDVPLFDMYTYSRITGTLHVKLDRDPATGEVVRLFTLDVDKAEQVSG